MTHLFRGIDYFASTPANAGHGVWLNATSADDLDPRSAAIQMNVGEAAIHRTNWMRHRLINWLEGGSYNNAAMTFTGALFKVNTLEATGSTVIDGNLNVNATYPLGVSTFRVAIAAAVNAGDVSVSSTLSVAGTANLHATVWATSSVLMGTVTDQRDRTVQGFTKRVTAAAWEAGRPPVYGPNADATIDAKAQDVVHVPALSTARSWILADPGTSAMARVTIYLSSVVAGTRQLKIFDSNGTTQVGEFWSSRPVDGSLFIEFAWSGSHWYALTWGKYVPSEFGGNTWVTVG